MMNVCTPEGVDVAHPFARQGKWVRESARRAPLAARRLRAQHRVIAAIRRTHARARCTLEVVGNPA